MLTSGSQYLRPEYLSPLPTTLDAKKSPLALLAQTCSNIGADNPNNKPIIPPLEKPKDSDKNKEKSSSSSSSNSSSSDDKPSFKPYESTKKDEIDVEKKTPVSKAASPANSSCSPLGSSSAASCGKASPMSDSGSNAASKTDGKDSLSSAGSVSAPSSLVSSGASSGSQTTLSGLGYGSAASLGLDLGRSDPTKDPLGSMSHLSLGAYKAGLNGALNPLAGCTGCTQVVGHIPVDAVSTAHTFAPSITTQTSSTLKPGAYPVGSALSPYVGYARVKTVSGGTTLVPVCRDPYCTNCQLSMQSAQLSTCPSGCSQCTHERLGPALSGLGPSLMPNLTGSPSPAAAAVAAAAAAAAAAGAGGPVPGPSSQLYSHSMLPRPNVCSWMVGDTYCGKRFTTSEELLQHLRTHTNLSAADAAAALPLISPTLTMPSAVGLSAAACHLHYSTAPSLTSPAGLRRTYPTSLSPVSSLSAASRYHPYKPPLPTFPGAPLAPLPHPGLGMYYSPYGFYGQRLGPPVHP